MTFPVKHETHMTDRRPPSYDITMLAEIKVALVEEFSPFSLVVLYFSSFNHKQHRLYRRTPRWRCSAEFIRFNPSMETFYQRDLFRTFLSREWKPGLCDDWISLIELIKQTSSFLPIKSDIFLFKQFYTRITTDSWAHIAPWFTQNQSIILYKVWCICTVTHVQTGRAQDVHTPISLTGLIWLLVFK